MQTDNRPLSPHVQVYKQGWTGTPSILHRITGAVTTAGSVLLIWWLVALASGPEAFATAQGFFGSIVGQVFLFALTWTLIYHTLAGIRHLFWDAVIGVEVDRAVFTAKLIVFGSIGITVLLWIIAYTVGGA
ncbi:succinate dehydrogenase, cytochrome b556 subunit [Alkalilimnicola sp. S0819]|uniref:succinate dehydrogenase, cytochrome b556 subunit n=1 Tax=Alkalilimnicola sp. S0819 TaxID=2613922 RepID=UPI0012615E26|nr:succinate dehydrogenase, cytochrome b556 subunit [Alkalilimnicola sp. S0819]KAB7627545.1 succinate dehydrogenase, cytochrome b556 subunit [Alkalilimnicola sp. S0819]MPQ15701.1 succinate dehydrogenase, cytochrome b556 subunit [Alkalilimnicola sp. S0819]